MIKIIGDQRLGLDLNHQMIGIQVVKKMYHKNHAIVKFFTEVIMNVDKMIQFQKYIHYNLTLMLFKLRNLESLVLFGNLVIGLMKITLTLEFKGTRNFLIKIIIWMILILISNQLMLIIQQI